MKSQLKFYGQIQQIHISKHTFISGYTQIPCNNSTASYILKQDRTNIQYSVCKQDSYWGFQGNLKTFTK